MTLFFRDKVRMKLEYFMVGRTDQQFDVEIEDGEDTGQLSVAGGLMA